MRVSFGVVVCILINLYRLASLQDVNISTTTTSYGELPYSSTVSTFSIVPTSTANISLSTPGENCLSPTPPEYQNISIGKTAASITWSIYQYDYECIPLQINVTCVALEEENVDGWNWVKNSSLANVTISEYNTTIVQVEVEDLSEFTNYTCNAILIFYAEESEATEIAFQTNEEISSPPSNLSVSSITSTTFSIKWAKPEKNPGVFRNYHIAIRSDGADYFVPDECAQSIQNVSYLTTEEEFMFDEARPNYNYIISVFVENGAGISSNANASITTKTSESEEPRNVTFGDMELQIDLNIINGNLSWNTPCLSNGPINTFRISLEGYFILDSSVEDIRTFAVNTTDSDEYVIPIEELMPASDYIISIRAEGIDQWGVSYNVSFRTEDNVPGPPVINNIMQKGSDFFIVSWKEPEQNSGNITNYDIEIVPLGPLYELDLSRCIVHNQPTFERLDGGVLMYNFTKGYPYYEYTIIVTAFTSKGPGNFSNMSIVTNTSVPEQVQRFKFSFTETEDITGMLSWFVPCNINGPIQEFIITLNGTYSEDGSEPTNYTKTIPYQNSSFNYSFDVQLLEAYNYEANVWIVLEDNTSGENATEYLTTPDGYPGAPTLNLSGVGANYFTIFWNPPNTKSGRIRNYRVNITSHGPLYKTRCNVMPTFFSNVSDGNTTVYNFNKGQPHYGYSVSLEASTMKGFGNVSEYAIETNQSGPENVWYIPPKPTYPTGEDYNAFVNISFEEPCLLNGPLKYFELYLVGTRPNHGSDVQRKQTSHHFFVCDLKPEYNYTFWIRTFNEKYYNETEPDYFLAPAGVPQFPSEPINLDIKKSSSGAKFMLRKDYFNETAGDIKYVALILSDRNVTGGQFNRWDGKDWPPANMDNVEYYQLTDDWWDPFKDTNNITINIGNGTSCKETEQYCNKPLEHNKEYYLIVRLFTSSFYKNSPTIYFKTDDISKLGTILAILFGLLGFALLGVGGFVLWKKKLLKLPPLYSRKSSTVSCNNNTTTIPIHKFSQYSKNLENNPEKCTEQYTLLAEKTKEAVRMKTIVYSGLTENRRKNRYTNILPYDDTRVKLLIEEDDEIGSDYINASYIKGYSGKVEYIATQGPLQATCRDFWKMVIQENVSIIVMVTQFVEQNKEKCFKYFPNNHESMIVGEDMEVRCAMELHFGTYCVRTLQVKKDSTQVSVTHMQYLDWPDFSVPTGTETMLQFCYQLRERLKIEGGCVIIHCSAGVGRTGTLIATDILLQNIKAGNNIDIFNTVLELRKQRTHMVQTQKQYMYIHNLIRDSLEQLQGPGLNENTEPLYENIPVLQMKHDDNNLINKENEVESQF